MSVCDARTNVFEWYITTFRRGKQVAFYQNIRENLGVNMSKLPKFWEGTEILRKN